MNYYILHSHTLDQECIIKISPLYTLDHIWLVILNLTTTYIKSFEGEKSTDDHNCSNQIIVIVIISVLLAVIVVCIVGLVIKNKQLNKKLTQAKSKEL